VSTIIIKPSQLAIICLSFAEYVVEAFTDDCPPTPEMLKVVGITTVGEFRPASYENLKIKEVFFVRTFGITG
jgi:hypothetical protein